MLFDKTEPHLNQETQPESMEDDWIANFFDKCRIVSDSDMQTLWGRVLAGEANAPGTYSKRTVNLLSDFDKSDAELFTKLCGLGWLSWKFYAVDIRFRGGNLQRYMGLTLTA